jgi:galactose mutarotase-like enzyme
MSDWYQIESNQVIVQVVSKGAELKRLFNKVWNKEMLWLGDEKLWNRSSPMLFPIVGTLIDNEFIFDDKTYSLNRHGFARDQEFICKHCGENELEFLLMTNKEMYKTYPFIFELLVHYRIVESTLTVTYKVKNLDKKDMFFSIGAHPGFDLTNAENCEIIFDREQKSYFQLNELGQVKINDPIEFQQKSLLITKDLFKKDALIFKDSKLKSIEIRDKKSKDSIVIKCNQASYWGIWGHPSNQFICIEPWEGISDVVGHNKQLKDKLGVVKLSPGSEYKFQFEIEQSKVL